MSIKLLSFMVSLCVAAAAYAQLATTRAGAPTRDTSIIAPDGTAYITRIIPVPATVSPDAQKQIALARYPAPFRAHLTNPPK